MFASFYQQSAKRREIVGVVQEFCIFAHIFKLTPRNAEVITSPRAVLGDAPYFMLAAVSVGHLISSMNLLLFGILKTLLSNDNRTPIFIHNNESMLKRRSIIQTTSID